MTSRAEKIDQIIASRQSTVANTEKVLAQIRNIRSALERIQRFEQNDKIKLDDELAGQFFAVLPEVVKYIDELDDSRKAFEQLKARLSRQTLNIGIIGRARQGKSTFLQSLTSLDDGEIPTGDKGHCTGAPSSVIHHDRDDTYAIVEYFREQEFMDHVIRPYFEQLELGDPLPYSLDDFAEFKLPETPPKAGATNDEFLKRLKYRQTGLPQYRHLLQGGQGQIPKEQIREYIAQEDKDGNKTPKWLAVKKATIYTKLPSNTDIGKVAVCDTPGLGDFVSGAEKSLVKTVGDNLDIVLFLRRPDAHGAILTPEDTQLYDLVKNAFPELTLSDWSHFLINQTAENEKMLDFFSSELEKSAIRTRSRQIVDCKGAGSVSQCFDALLTDLAGALQICDEKLLKIRTDNFEKLRNELSVFANSDKVKLFQSANHEVTDEDFVEVGKKFGNNESGLWNELNAGLETLRQEYDDAAQKEDDEFKSSLEQLRKKLEDEKWGIPVEDLTKIPVSKRVEWFVGQTSKNRRRVSELIEEMSKDFGNRFDILRNKAKEVFENAGLLKNVQWESDTDNISGDWWDGLQVGIQNSLETQTVPPIKPIILHAISRFQRATLSFDEFLEPRIRPCLYCLDQGKDEANDTWATPADAKNPQILLDKLLTAAQIAYSAACNEIDKLRPEPGLALFAAIEKFIDYAFTGTAVWEQWRRLYHDYRSQIWDFKASQLDRKFVRDWDEAVNKLKECCR